MRGFTKLTNFDKYRNLIVQGERKYKTSIIFFLCMIFIQTYIYTCI